MLFNKIIIFKQKNRKNTKNENQNIKQDYQIQINFH